MHLSQLPVPSNTSGIAALRWALVVIFVMFGTAKVAAYEAEGVAGIATNYPLFAWMYPLWGVQGASNAIGIVELATALMLAAGAWSARASVVGAAMGCVTFLITLSFMLGATIWEDGYGAPFLGSTGQFLVKDIVLLAGCYAILIASLRRAGWARG